MNLPLPFVDAVLPPVPRKGAPAPEDLHPALWRAHQLGGGRQGCTATGFAELDAELPGGGWPHHVLTELLLPHPGLGELRLLAPALAAVLHPADGSGRPARTEGGRCAMLFDPPAAPCSQALAQLGLDARQLLVVRPRDPGGAAHGRSGAARGGQPPGRVHPLRPWLPSADVLWALEQALKSGHVGAVLAWLPAPIKADALRRLQLAAQSHDGPAFVFREAEARHRPSAAPLRLLLQAGEFDELTLHVLKRRGPPLAQPLRLALPPVLAPLLRERAQAHRQATSRAPAVAVRPGRAASV